MIDWCLLIIGAISLCVSVGAFAWLAASSRPKKYHLVPCGDCLIPIKDEDEEAALAPQPKEPK